MSDSIEMELQNYYTRQRAGEAQDAGLVPAPPPPPSDMEKLGSFAKSLGLDLEPGMVETMIQQHLPDQAVPMDLVKGLDAVLKIVGVPFKAVGLAAQNIVGPILEAAHPDASPEAIQAGKDAIGTAAEFASPLLYKALGQAAPHVARHFNRIMAQEAGALRYGAGEGIRGFLGPSGEHYLAGREGHRFADVAKDIRETGVRYRMVEEPGRGIPTRLAVDIRKPLTSAERSEILKMSRDAEQTIVDYPGGTGEAHTTDDLRRLLQETDSFFGQARTSALANEISGVHAQAGGSTFNLTTGKNLVGQEGYAVSTFKGHEKILDHAPTAQDIEQYISSLPAEIRSNPNLSLGTWESGGKHYLDVSQVEPDLNKALALGQQHQQQAVFDLKNLKDVPVPGAQSVGAARAGELGSKASLPVVGPFPTHEELVAAFEKGKIGKDWYVGSLPALEKFYGPYANLAARIGSAVSVMQDPLDEVRIMAKVMSALEKKKDISALTPKQVQTIVYNSGGGMFTRSMAPNVRRAIQGEDLSGLKVPEYLQGKLENPNTVAMDRHVARFMNVNTSSPASVEAGQNVIRQSAEKLGVTPIELQAAIWRTQQLATGVSEGKIPPKYADSVEKGMREMTRLGIFKGTYNPKWAALVVATILGELDGS